jgi:hypothetical protein
MHSLIDRMHFRAIYFKSFLVMIVTYYTERARIHREKDRDMSVCSTHWFSFTQGLVEYCHILK